MQLRMAIRGPEGQQDVRVDSQPGCSFATLRDEVAAIAGVDTAARWHADGRLLPSDALIGEPPLIEGAVLSPETQTSTLARPTARTGIELRVVAGPAAGAVYLLPAGDTVVGRGRSADLRLSDAATSRRHALISWRGLEVLVRDLGSSGGTWLNDQQVGSSPVPIRLGDQLTLGSSMLTLADSAGPCAASAADGAGGLATNRAPRMIQPTPTSDMVVPIRPPAREAGGFPWLASAVPLIVAVPMAWRFGGQMLAFTLLPVAAMALTGAAERLSRGKARRRALADYRDQLAAVDIEIAAAVEAEAALRRDEVPDAASLLRIVAGPSLRLWERRPGDHDMLLLRLGVSDQPARIAIRRGDPSGPAVPAPRSRCVPLTVSLAHHGVIGLSGDRSAAIGLLRFMIAQIAALHSPSDVRVVVISADCADDLAWTRWLPHTRPVAEDCTRLLGMGRPQAGARVGELAALVEARAAGRATPEGSNGIGGEARLVVVVWDGPRELRPIAGLSTILADGPAFGVYSVCVAPTMAELPTECAATVTVTDGQTGQVRLTESGRDSNLIARGELVPAAWADSFAKAVAPLRDLTPVGIRLPDSVRLLEILGLESLDPAAIADRWRAVPRSTVVVLGAAADGPVAADLAVDGPHVLVAGTTGSGKSELLEALVAGLAIANRPDELAIVLIDYKGGAAFAECARLPHTVAVVTDLDGLLARRALVSLRAELARRERVLRAAGVPDIESLRPLEPRSTAAVRLNRLVIIVDEFAALAEELPDFMAGLVALAQRGRSLGIHLVLATQRPAGVVSAEIRANTNMRIALRMTDPADSYDVIDSPDAARIPRQRPGRAYLKVGAGAPTAFQTGQITRIPSADSGSPWTVTVEPWQTLGDPVPRADRSDRGHSPSDMYRLATAIEAAAGASGLGRLPSPWLPPLPKQLTLDQLAGFNRSDPSGDRVPVGLCDLPSGQQQHPLWLDLAAGKHWLVIGGAGTGKSTALRSIAAAVASGCSPADAHVYALDCAGGALAGLTALPHTGAVVGPDQAERGVRLVARLDREVTDRQRELARLGFASLAEQRSDGAGKPAPARLVLLIDGWDGFLRTYQELDHGRAVDLCNRLLTDGPTVGLTVVVTGDRSTLTGRIGSLIANRLVLALNDPADYSLAGLTAPDAGANWPPGRGRLVTGSIETQIALIGDDPSSHAQQRALERCAAGVNPSAAASTAAGAAPFQIPELPTEISLGELLPGLATLAPPDGFWLPVGIGGDELTPIGIPLEAGQSVLVAGPSGSGRSTTLAMAARWYLSRGISVALAEARPCSRQQVDLEGSGQAEMLGRFGPNDGAKLLSAIGALGSRPLAVLVDDAEELLDSPLEAAVLSCPHAYAVRLVAGCLESMSTLYRGLVPHVRRSRRGLLLGRYHATDGELLGSRVGASINPRPGRGVLVHGGVIPIQVALP